MSDAERCAFEAWYEQWRVSTWWKDAPCPAHWNTSSKQDCERGWMARALSTVALAQPACTHDETERLGAIWTRCTQCGKKWADDEQPAIKETP